MRNFIRKSLTNAFHESRKGKNEFDYQFNRADGDSISIKGSVSGTFKNRVADFRIERIKSNGHHCSAIPVFGMPLTDKCISDIVEIALENL